MVLQQEKNRTTHSAFLSTYSFLLIATKWHKITTVDVDIEADKGK